MTSTASGQRRERAFLLAGAVLLLGLVDGAVGFTGLDVWQWLVAAGLAVTVGLRRLASTLEGRVYRTVRVLTVIAATGAGLYLVVTISFLAADVRGVRLPSALEGVFVVGAFSLLGGIVLASIGIGGAMVLRGASSRLTGCLVVVVGTLFLSPLPALLAVDLPEAIALAGVAALAAVLGVLGARTPPAVRPGARGG